MGWTFPSASTLGAAAADNVMGAGIPVSLAFSSACLAGAGSDGASSAGFGSSAGVFSEALVMLFAAGAGGVFVFSSFSGLAGELSAGDSWGDGFAVDGGTAGGAFSSFGGDNFAAGLSGAEGVSGAGGVRGAVGVAGAAGVTGGAGAAGASGAAGGLIVAGGLRAAGGWRAAGVAGFAD